MGLPLLFEAWLPAPQGRCEPMTATKSQTILPAAPRRFSARPSKHGPAIALLRPACRSYFVVENKVPGLNENARNCVVCVELKLLSETKIRVRRPFARVGPKVTPSMLSGTMP